MGTFSSWSYTGRCTVWQPTFDAYDQPTAYTRTVHACSFKAGGNLALGSEQERFVPQTTIFLEAAEANVPKVGSYVALSEVAGATPPADAEIIRRVTQHDPSLFDEGIPDWVLITG